MASAVVTGGAGFIGSHLVDALVERGDDCTVVDDLSSGLLERVHPAAPIEQADVRDAAVLTKIFAAARPAVCFHLAAQADVRVSVARPGYDAEVNVLGMINVLEAARAHGTRVVFASTGGAIYGDVESIPTPESVTPEPRAAYGTAKLCAEHYLAMYSRLYGTAPRGRTYSATAARRGTTCMWTTSWRPCFARTRLESRARGTSARAARCRSSSSSTCAPAWRAAGPIRACSRPGWVSCNERRSTRRESVRTWVGVRRWGSRTGCAACGTGSSRARIRAGDRRLQAGSQMASGSTSATLAMAPPDSATARRRLRRHARAGSFQQSRCICPASSHTS
jgi:NAD(P)-dependent dehydrogenase (short-subunit alcohol dehydrogenase family)